MKQVDLACGVWDTDILPEFDRLISDNVIRDSIIGPNKEILQNLGWTENLHQCRTIMSDVVQAQKMEDRMQLQDSFEFPKKMAVLLGSSTNATPFFVHTERFRDRHWASGLAYGKNRRCWRCYCCVSLLAQLFLCVR